MSAIASVDEIRRAGKLTARDAGGQTVQAFFEANKTAIAAVLPKHIRPERMLRLALGAIRQTPKLAQCELNSLMGAVLVSAQLGLEPNTPLGHAYLIPFENRKKGIVEVQFVPGYRGLIDLCRRSGQIVSLSAHVVCERDEFDYAYGLDERLIHKPSLDERGAMIAAYAVARIKDGGHQFEVMSKADIDKIRSQSRAASNGPWVTHYEEMSRKTPIRRLSKLLPMSIEIATAIELDGLAAAGEDQHLEAALEGVFSVEPPAEPAEAPEAAA